LRAAPQPPFFDKLRRLAWALVDATLYRWSPAPLHGFLVFDLPGGGQSHFGGKRRR